MNKHRLRTEIAALQKQYTVRVNPDWTIDLVRFNFPAGWTPRTGTIKYDIPADYESSPPTVHIPADMQYQGQQNIRRKLWSPHDGYAKWCVRFKGWDPRRHTLTTVTREMVGSLSDPSRRRLFTDPE